MAAWYGFRFGGADWYYQLGRDPEWDKESIGLVLLAHTIRAPSTTACRTYRLLRGGESYKARFATADPGIQTGGRPRGPRASAQSRRLRPGPPAPLRAASALQGRDR